MATTSPITTTTPASDRIAAVGVAILRIPLPRPIVFSDWVARDRDYALVSARS